MQTFSADRETYASDLFKLKSTRDSWGFFTHYINYHLLLLVMLSTLPMHTPTTAEWIKSFSCLCICIENTGTNVQRVVFLSSKKLNDFWIIVLSTLNGDDQYFFSRFFKLFKQLQYC
jgi:hypothetical protein